MKHTPISDSLLSPLDRKHNECIVYTVLEQFGVKATIQYCKITSYRYGHTIDEDNSNNIAQSIWWKEKADKLSKKHRHKLTLYVLGHMVSRITCKIWYLISAVSFVISFFTEDKKSLIIAAIALVIACVIDLAVEYEKENEHDSK